MSERSVRPIVHSDLNLHPYKFQIVHSLNDREKELRLQFYRHFQEILTGNLNLPNKLLMSSEAHFHFHGSVNTQNFRSCSAANPHELFQRPIYDQNVTLDCDVWSRRGTGPYFFEDEHGQVITVIPKCYTETIN
jgi:hypothetical protein